MTNTFNSPGTYGSRFRAGDWIIAFLTRRPNCFGRKRATSMCCFTALWWRAP